MKTSRIFAPLYALVLLAPLGCQEPAAPDGPAAQGTPDAGTEQQVLFANTKCPIMGGKPTPELTTTYEGKTIGFCCEGCPEKWAELSAEEKAAKFAKVAKDDGDASS